MQHRTRWVAGLSAALLTLLLAATVSGYTGQVASSITIAVHGSSACGHPIRLTATVLDGDGKPIARQSVDWTLVLTLSSNDKVNKTPTTTNSKGVASTTVTLACLNGSREVRATAGSVSGQAVLNVAIRSLPNTGTLPEDRRVFPGILPASLLIVAGVLTLRRFTSTRR
jgi:hypothetical protein